MSSNTITRNDLKNILNEVLPYKDKQVSYCTINANTATTRKSVLSFSHTSTTGKIIFISSIALYTSRYTSSVEVDINGVAKAVGQTNVQLTPTYGATDRVVLLGYANVPKNEASTIEVFLQGQDSGTTATIPSYHTSNIMVIDI